MGLFSKKSTNQSTSNTSDGYGYWMLYLYFDVEKVSRNRKGNIVEICYQELYRTVPTRDLKNSMLFAGDCLSDLRKFVIGVGTQNLNQLKTIQQYMGKSIAFKEICADPPMRLVSEWPTNKSEPIIYDGMLRQDHTHIPVGDGDEIKAFVETTEGGTGWAKYAWDKLKK